METFRMDRTSGHPARQAACQGSGWSGSGEVPGDPPPEQGEVQEGVIPLAGVLGGGGPPWPLTGYLP
jgi:hypothetical protein